MLPREFTKVAQSEEYRLATLPRDVITVIRPQLYQDMFFNQAGPKGSDGREYDPGILSYLDDTPLTLRTVDYCRGAAGTTVLLHKAVLSGYVECWEYDLLATARRKKTAILVSEHVPAWISCAAQSPQLLNWVWFHRDELRRITADRRHHARLTIPAAKLDGHFVLDRTANYFRDHLTIANMNSIGTYDLWGETYVPIEFDHLCAVRKLVSFGPSTGICLTDRYLHVYDLRAKTAGPPPITLAACDLLVPFRDSVVGNDKLNDSWQYLDMRAHSLVRVPNGSSKNVAFAHYLRC